MVNMSMCSNEYFKVKWVKFKRLYVFYKLIKTSPAPESIKTSSE